MARGIVLTDASPLIGLARVNGLPWLRALFGEVWMPIEVRSEVLSDKEFPEEASIRLAEAEGWLKTWGPSPDLPELTDLDEGEASCIHIGLTQEIPALLLMDERAGRAVAAEYGLRVAGTAAVIGMAKSRQLTDSARAIFERSHASDFRVSAQVISAVLRRVGE